MSGIKALERLRLRVQRDPVGTEMENLIQNPSGDLGGWGWITPLANTAVSGGSAVVYTDSKATTTASYFYSETMPVTVGEYAAATWLAKATLAGSGGTVGERYRARFEWIASDGVTVLSSGTQTGLGGSGSYVQSAISPTLVPSSAVYVRIRFDMYTSAGVLPATGKLELQGVTVATAATSGALVQSRANLEPNPSFETNLAGWAGNNPAGSLTQARSTAKSFSGTASMALTDNITTRQFIMQQVVAGIPGPRRISITGGLSYAVSAYVAGSTSGGTAAVTISWIAASGTTAGPAVTGASAAVATTMGRISAIGVAPPGATHLMAEFKHAGASPGQTTYLDAVLIEQDSTVGTYIEGTVAVGAIPVLPPAYYIDILPAAANLGTERSELQVGTLVGTVVSSTLDPSVATHIRPGRRVILESKDDDGAWSPIFTGRLRVASVEYRLLENDPDRRAVITLSAVDAISTLSQVAAPDGVATISELPYVLEGAGVPWNVNESGNQVPTATIVASNDQASVVDQVAVTRDSNSGYAWCDRRGVVCVADASSLAAMTTDRGTWTESTYTADIGIDYSTDRVANIVSVDAYEMNPATGETAVARYGPYRDETSIKTWGPWETTLTVQGLSESAIATLAASILTAKGTPVRRASYVSISVNDNADLSWAPLLDLYDMVRITNDRANLDQTLRITGIEHAIEASAERGTNWLIKVSFAVDGSTAPAQLIPKPSTGNGRLPETASNFLVGDGVRIQSGNIVLAATGGVTPAMAFSTPFSAAPVITVTGGNGEQIAISTVSATDVSFNAFSPAGAALTGSIRVLYTAIGPA